MIDRDLEDEPADRDCVERFLPLDNCLGVVSMLYVTQDVVLERITNVHSSGRGRSARAETICCVR